MNDKPEVQNVNVMYKEGIPKRITVSVVHGDGGARCRDEYKLKVNEYGDAKLTLIDVDTGRYAWPARQPSRKAVADAVRDLPFVQSVDMPGADE